MAWHIHANPTFFLLLRGQHRDRSRLAECDQPELTLAFHPTTEPHGGSVGAHRAIGLNIEYSSTWLANHELSEVDLGGYRVLSSMKSKLQVVQFLGASFYSGECGRPECEIQAFELLEPLVQFSAPLESSALPAWLSRVEDFMHAQFRIPISLRACAREANVHPVHLARVFRKRHGCTVSQYLRTLRLIEASRLVLREGWPITEAAYGAGFADHAHLTRCCSLRVGFTPRALLAAKKALGL